MKSQSILPASCTSSCLMLMIWSSRARNRSPDPVVSCFFGRIAPSDAATESCFSIRGNRENEIASFQGLRHRNLAISSQQSRRKTTLAQWVRSSSRATPYRCPRLAVLRQFVEHGFEILGLAEIAIDRGEAHVSDVVEGAQRLHHHLAHGLGGDFAFALALELAHDLGHGLVDALGLDRTLAQRDLHRAQQLVAVERHAAAVALDDHELAQLHAFERGKAEIAAQAHPAAADDGGILGRPRVLDLRIEAAAIRTAHGYLPLPVRSLPSPNRRARESGHPVITRAAVPRARAHTSRPLCYFIARFCGR